MSVFALVGSLVMLAWPRRRLALNNEQPEVPQPVEQR
jgi:hypothetical protein